MFCLPTSVVTGLPPELSAVIRRFAIGSTLDQYQTGRDEPEEGEEGEDAEEALARAIEPYSPQQLASLYIANMLVGPAL